MAYHQSEPLTKVELHISCHKLVNLDLTSLSDPQVYVELKGQGAGWLEVGRTEMIKDNLNPKFAKSVILDYRFEEVQTLRFTVVDVDKENGKLADQDLIGILECSVAEIVGSKGSSITRPLQHQKKKAPGFITVSAEEVQDLKMTATFRLSGAHLDKKDMFGKSDPFLVISKSKEDGSWIKVHQTEVKMKTLDPIWAAFDISVSKLNGGDFERVLRFECFDWNKSGNPDFIGQFQASLRTLQETKQIPLINPSKQKKKKYENSGIIAVSIELKKEFGFLDYIVGGCQISLMVAIDFTASNGNPQFANSLHYINPYQPNEYEKAILAVGNILAYYDSDQMFPVYGFGAKVPPTGMVSHCFPLNGNSSNPEVHGINGILDVYRQGIQTCTLYGPTNLGLIVDVASQIAQHSSQEAQQYLILMIITDGEITDMDATIAAIVKASRLPLSIIIVGVGKADFTKMETLDGDDKALSHGGQTAERDIVQFVPFSNYTAEDYSRLAADTLAEVPGQFVSYMKAHGIVPNAPLPPQAYDFEQAPPM